MSREENVVIETHHNTIHAMGRKNEPRPLRYMQKDGRFPVIFQTPSKNWSPYLADIFTTLVEIRWSVVILFFCLSYILSWLFFGLCYWLIAHVNGDADNPDEELCVATVRGFTGAFMYSMETQATIGYGVRGMTENCMVAIVVVTIQDIFSCLLDTIVIGIIIAKMASARKRAQTVGFSRFAVVNLRDGVLCLSWRLGDLRGNHILEGVIKATLVRYKKQPLGFVVMSYQDLDVQNREIILATPTTIIHKLEPGSPLYNLGPEDLPDDHFELVVSFTYTGDSTGLLHQTRISYTPADIRWAQRFHDVLKVGKKRYKVDYAKFNETTWVPVPMVSAEELHRSGRQAQSDQSSLVTAPSIRGNGHAQRVAPDVTVEVMQQTCL